MSMSDPLGDMLTRIRNAQRAKKSDVVSPASRLRENVLEVLGAVDSEVFSRLIRCIIQGDVASTMKILDEVVIKGRELGQFVNDFIWYLRNLMLVKGSEDSCHG